MENERDYTISAVKKALNILKLFNEDTQELTLSQVSSLSGIGKSSILRMLYTLVNEGFLEYDEDTRKYSLGFELFRLGQIKYAALDIRKIARKYLKPVCDQNNLIGYLAVRHGDDLAMVEQVFPYKVPLWSQLLIQDNLRALYSTGIGRLFLAQESDEAVEQYLDRVPITPFTKETITDKATLKELIRQARSDGYSGNVGENEDLICSICAPIYNQSGLMIAGVSLCGPHDVIWGGNFDQRLALVKQVARDISRELGYSG